MPEKIKGEIATLAAGCFWGVEELFCKLPGVLDTRVGYTGGEIKDPTYDQVCGDQTGHVEAIEIIFDPNTISYREILEKFWAGHNPTTPNRQGPDIGSQYRSAIFYHSDEQKQIALELKAELDDSDKYLDPIVTLIEPAGVFYKAEEYHQHYLEKKK